MQQKDSSSSYAGISRGLKQPLFWELDKNRVLFITTTEKNKQFCSSKVEKIVNFVKQKISKGPNYQYFLNGEDFHCFLSSIHCRFTRYIFTMFTHISLFVNPHNVIISFATLISWLTLPYSAVTVDLELSDSPTLPL